MQNGNLDHLLLGKPEAVRILEKLIENPRYAAGARAALEELQRGEKAQAVGQELDEDERRKWAEYLSLVYCNCSADDLRGLVDEAYPAVLTACDLIERVYTLWRFVQATKVILEFCPREMELVGSTEYYTVSEKKNMLDKSITAAAWINRSWTALDKAIGLIARFRLLELAVRERFDDIHDQILQHRVAMAQDPAARARLKLAEATRATYKTLEKWGDEFRKLGKVARASIGAEVAAAGFTEFQASLLSFGRAEMKIFKELH